MSRVFSHLFSGLILSLLLLLFYFPLALLINRKRKIYFLRHLVIFSFLTTSFIILFATLLFGNFVESGYRSPVNLWPLAWIRDIDKVGLNQVFSQLISNILMFIPLGLLLPLVFKKLKKFTPTILIISGISLIIEFHQYFIGRSADITNLITNTLGGIIGYGFYSWLNQTFHHKPRWTQIKSK